MAAGGRFRVAARRQEDDEDSLSSLSGSSNFSQSSGSAVSESDISASTIVSEVSSRTASETSSVESVYEGTKPPEGSVPHFMQLVECGRLSGNFRVLKGSLADAERCPIWKHELLPCWLYCGPSGHWYLGDDDAEDEDFQKDIGDIRTKKPHEGVWPHNVEKGGWESLLDYAADEWKDEGKMKFIRAVDPVPPDFRSLPFLTWMSLADRFVPEMEMGVEEVLPEGWEAHEDPETGETYFHNPEVGETQWESPAVPMARMAAQAAQRALVIANKAREEEAEESERSRMFAADEEMWIHMYKEDEAKYYHFKEATFRKVQFTLRWAARIPEACNDKTLGTLRDEMGLMKEAKASNWRPKQEQIEVAFLFPAICIRRVYCRKRFKRWATYVLTLNKKRSDLVDRFKVFNFKEIMQTVLWQFYAAAEPRRLGREEENMILALQNAFRGVSIRAKIREVRQEERLKQASKYQLQKLEAKEQIVALQRAFRRVLMFGRARQYWLGQRRWKSTAGTLQEKRVHVREQILRGEKRRENAIVEMQSWLRGILTRKRTRLLQAAAVIKARSKVIRQERLPARESGYEEKAWLAEAAAELTLPPPSSRAEWARMQDMEASRIQANWRGRQDRKYCTQLKTKKRRERNMEEKSRHREELARRRERAAVVIQSQARGMLAKKGVAKLTAREKANHERARQARLRLEEKERLARQLQEAQERMAKQHQDAEAARLEREQNELQRMIAEAKSKEIEDAEERRRAQDEERRRRQKQAEAERRRREEQRQQQLAQEQQRLEHQKNEFKRMIAQARARTGAARHEEGSFEQETWPEYDEEENDYEQAESPHFGSSGLAFAAQAGTFAARVEASTMGSLPRGNRRLAAEQAPVRRNWAPGARSGAYPDVGGAGSPRTGRWGPTSVGGAGAAPSVERGGRVPRHCGPLPACQRSAEGWLPDTAAGPVGGVVGRFPAPVGGRLPGPVGGRLPADL